MDRSSARPLAYVFWHRPRRADGYDAALADFHAELARERPPFLLASAAYRVRDLPWLDAGEGYEDWYVVRDYAGLGQLNQAAVAGRVGTAHDRAAALAAWGTAGLYAVVRGAPALDARRVTWLDKPPGRGYPEFLASLPETPGLVQRQLVLGPAPEFCVPGEVSGGLVADREPVFRRG